MKSADKGNFYSFPIITQRNLVAKKINYKKMNTKMSFE